MHFLHFPGRESREISFLISGTFHLKAVLSVWQAPATKRIILGVANFDLDLELMRESLSFCRIADNNNWLAQSISDFNGLHTESESTCTWELCQKGYFSSDESSFYQFLPQIKVWFEIKLKIQI